MLAAVCGSKNARNGPRRCCRPCYRCWPKPCREIRTRRQELPRLELAMARLEIPCQAMKKLGISKWENRWPKWSIVRLAMFDYQRVNPMPLTYHDWGWLTSQDIPLIPGEIEGVIYASLELRRWIGFQREGKLIWAKIWIASWSSRHCIGMCKTKLLLLERRIAPATCATWI